MKRRLLQAWGSALMMLLFVPLVAAARSSRASSATTIVRDDGGNVRVWRSEMRGLVVLGLALGMVAGGVGTAAAQSFGLGGLGFGLLGGGAGVGVSGTHAPASGSTGISFGTELETTIGVSESLDAATEGLAGAEMIKTPSRLVPEDIPVGHTEEITSGR